MTLEVAEKIACERINTSTCTIDRVSESENYFIFSVASVDSKGITHPLIAPPIGVHKKTGEIVAFNPVRFRSEMASVKRIR